MIEAGEILELLGEQLVDLEQQPEDNELLNAIFRGFHTVKGGAGFLSITNLVEICHRTEDLFNLLRQGEAVADAGIMDVALRALDSVNAMFDMVRNGEEPPPADSVLLEQLSYIVKHKQAPGGESDAGAAAPEPEPEASAEPAPASPSGTAPSPDGDLTDQEFQQLLDAAAGGDASADTAAGGKEESTEAPESASDDITDDEFEALLDQLHGEGQFGEVEEAQAPAPAAEAGTDSDEITDDEFEALLDELHGQGQFNVPSEGEEKPAGKPAQATAKPKSAPPAKKKSSKPKPARPAAARSEGGALRRESPPFVSTPSVSTRL